jgi:IPT/TIG domain
VAQPNLYATNFRLDGVQPRLLLRNTGLQTISATPRFIPAPGDPNNFIDLPSMTLNPNQTADVDMETLKAATLGKSEFDHVSIQVLNNGAPGSLIGALNGTDNKMTYDIPLRDIGGMRNSTGTYPWRLDQDVSTVVSLTNTGTVSSGILVLIRYPGGPYQLDPRPLASGETVFYDLREIRDKQIPDRDGRTIPRSVKGGQFKWSIYGFDPGSGRIIGRAEMISQSQGISSSYSCPGGNCPMEFSYAFLSDDSPYLTPGEAAATTAYEVWCDAYGCTGPFGANVDSWDEDNPLIATLISNSNVANLIGVDGGDTGFWANISHDRWGWDGLNCYWLGWFVDNAYGTASVLKMDSISPSRGVVSATTAVTITGKNFRSGASLVIDGTGVSSSNVTVSSSTTITANLVVASNASGGNRTIKVRSNNKNSNGKSFFVQIPSKLIPFNHQLAPNGIEPLNTPVNQPVLTLDGQFVIIPAICGVYRHYLFYLADQDNPAQEIVNRPFGLGEIFTNYSGAFSTPTFTPVTVGAGQIIADLQTLGFPGSTCLGPTDNEQFDQQFKITFGGHDYFPTTKIHIERGNFNGSLKVDRTIVTQ